MPNTDILENFQQELWINATKVETVPVVDKDIAPPAKRDKITGAQLKEELKKLMTNWGEYGQRNIWNIMI